MTSVIKKITKKAKKLQSIVDKLTSADRLNGGVVDPTFIKYNLANLVQDEFDNINENRRKARNKRKANKRK